MILTSQIIDQGKSSRGGWSNEQMRLLGVSDFTKGWRKRLIGSNVDEQNIKLFLGLKDKHLGGGKKIKTRKKPQFDYCDSKITYKDQYLHPNWQKMRLFVLNRDNFTCVECESRDITLHVHHLKYSKNEFIWSVPDWYLVTLCEVCHSKEHGRDLTITK